MNSAYPGPTIFNYDGLSLGVVLGLGLAWLGLCAWVRDSGV